MHETTHLSNLILRHWRIHRPRMVMELLQANHLTQAVDEAEKRAADLLYQYLAVEKMEYEDAWELAMQECLLPEEKSPSTSLSASLPATSD